MVGLSAEIQTQMVAEQRGSHSTLDAGDERERGLPLFSGR